MSRLMINGLKKSQLQDELLDISNEEAETIIGGLPCTYASLTYSTGSRVKQGDGNVYVCQADGSWR